MNPHTPLSTLDYVLADLDLILLMTVNPGFGGQSFIPAMVEKVRRLRAIADERGWAVDIQVDGGIKPATIAEVAQAGANVFVAGSAVFGSPDYRSAIAALRNGAVSGTTRGTDNGA